MKASALKNAPTTPWRSASGANTTTVVTVVPTMGEASDLAPSVAAAIASRPSCRFRAMASIMTIASSTTSPMATAMPPSDIRLSVCDAMRIPMKVMASVTGTVSAAMSPARKSRRNRAIVSAQSAMPTTMASRTLAIDSRTSDAWS